MPDMVPPAVSKSFAAMIPGFFIVTAALLIRIGFESTPFKSIHNVVSMILTKPLTAVGGSYFGAILITLLIHLLWTCGLHGANIILGIVDPALYVLMDQNRAAFEAGMRGSQLPNVVTRQFFDVFQSMGGSGATLSFVVMMLFWAPLACVTISYWSMKLGIVAKPTGIAIPWTTPPVIAGWLVTGDYKGGVVQIVNFFVTGIIYYPFFKMWDKKKLEEEKETDVSED